jgi:phosphocarrier,  HPr family
MVSKKITISNKTGLHLRPAGILSKIAGGCKSSVTLIKGDKKVNAKSVLNVMSAQINLGDEIIVECDGETEESDLQTVIEAIENGLGE